MSDRADSEADHTWEQIRLGLELQGYRHPTAPPVTREGCGQLERPCQRTTCVHNNLRDDEPSGRPSDGRDQRRMPIRVRRHVPAEESCALDVAQAHLDGMSRREVAEILDLGAPRVRQLEQRAAVKQRLVHDLFKLLEAFRERLPDGVELTVDTPRHGATHSALVVLTIEETAIPSVAARLGVTRRRKATEREDR